MQCSNCGQDNPDGMKFCGECGMLLKNRCPQCGFQNPPKFKFCGECGTSLINTSSASKTLDAELRAPDAQPPVTYTPRHLAERILAEQAAMEARSATARR
jgi:hypothetical protein